MTASIMQILLSLSLIRIKLNKASAGPLCNSPIIDINGDGTCDCDDADGTGTCEPYEKLFIIKKEIEGGDDHGGPIIEFKTTGPIGLPYPTAYFLNTKGTVIGAYEPNFIEHSGDYYWMHVIPTNLITNTSITDEEFASWYGVTFYNPPVGDPPTSEPTAGDSSFDHTTIETEDSGKCVLVAWKRLMACNVATGSDVQFQYGDLTMITTYDYGWKFEPAGCHDASADQNVCNNCRARAKPGTQPGDSWGKGNEPPASWCTMEFDTHPEGTPISGTVRDDWDATNDAYARVLHECPYQFGGADECCDNIGNPNGHSVGLEEGLYMTEFGIQVSDAANVCRWEVPGSKTDICGNEVHIYLGYNQGSTDCSGTEPTSNPAIAPTKATPKPVAPTAPTPQPVKPTAPTPQPVAPTKATAKPTKSLARGMLYLYVKHFVDL